MAAYANTVGAEDFPIFADGAGGYTSALPISEAHPILCATTPEFEILSCYQGHNKHLTALDDIRAHAGL